MKEALPGLVGGESAFLGVCFAVIFFLLRCFRPLLHCPSRLPQGGTTAMLRPLVLFYLVCCGRFLPLLHALPDFSLGFLELVLRSLVFLYHSVPKCRIHFYTNVSSNVPYIQGQIRMYPYFFGK